MSRSDPAKRPDHSDREGGLATPVNQAALASRVSSPSTLSGASHDTGESPPRASAVSMSILTTFFGQGQAE